jgi:hypothetical protein
MGMKLKLLLLGFFLITCQFTAICLSAPTLSAIQEEDVKYLMIAVHTSYTEYINDASFYTVRGIVLNNNTRNMLAVNVTANFYDTDSMLIATKTVPVASYIVEPDGKAPFEVYLSLNSNPLPQSYSLVVTGVETDEKQINLLEIENLSTSLSKEGFFLITGDVHNKGPLLAKSVRVICAYYALDGNLITISSDVVYPISVMPNEKSKFELSSAPFSRYVSNFELFIIVHHYESIFSANLILFSAVALVSFIFLIYMKRKGW